jgi:hypothetical protein
MSARFRIAARKSTTDINIFRHCASLKHIPRASLSVNLIKMSKTCS